MESSEVVDPWENAVDPNQLSWSFFFENLQFWMCSNNGLLWVITSYILGTKN